MSERTKAALLLAFLSPLIGEMLSGSSPPLEFFHPFSLSLLLGMYGTGVLLVRELTVMWGKGWASILALGAAYGVIEEGIAVKSFFDPGWMDLGVLAEYGRYLDVNWVWAFWLTIYHASISIGLPILITGILFPRLRGARLLGRRAFAAVALVFVIDIGVCIPLFAATQDYFPPLPQYLLAFVGAACLIWVAAKAPAGMVRARCPTPTWPPRRFLLLGSAFVTVTFVTAGAAPDPVPPVVMIALMLTICYIVLRLIQGGIGAHGNAPQRACLAVGMMALFIVLAPVQEIFNGVPGMTAVGLAFAAFSLHLMRRAARVGEATMSEGEMR